MGCLLAGLVDVPVYLSTAPEQMAYVIDHAEAEALIVANDEQLAVAQNLLPELERIRAVVVPDPGPETERASLPEGVELYTMDAVRAMGRDSTDDQDAAIADLRQAIATDDLATLIYTSGTTGQPKGVMLTHENISFNAMTSLSELTNFKPGPSGEVVLSFLPLTHIFARTLQYAFMICTAGVTVLDHGETPRAEVLYRDGASDEMDLSDTAPAKALKAVVSRSNKDVQDIEVTRVWYPNPFTGNGIVLVDTPGVNDPDHWREDITYSYLAEADAVIMMSPPISRVETPHDVAHTYSCSLFSLVNVQSNALAKFCPRK